MKELHEEKGYAILPMCKFMQVTRSAYLRWIDHPYSERTLENMELAKVIRTIHDEHPEKGYRSINDTLNREHAIHVNDKRVLRICRHEGIQSTIKHSTNSITKRSSRPYHTVENILDREFTAEAPNQKWLTDVTEFKYYVGPKVQKLYLSAILDLYDRRIVSYVIRDTNDLTLVFDTFDQAVALEPDAHPLFHSDRGFQYTHVNFYKRIVTAEMTQSMSQAGKCIDNGPMEGFWGIIKREQYYGKKFTSRSELVTMIDSYINYYNNGRYQRKLHILTPMEYHSQYYEAA
ncbi:IS3 family transposase [Candidatus Enterococcus ferrettii]|uniref:IS3 family transposase n=1 Tax=Candidatus Enterococcus ferrettii TaxID=2815324 RepID=UPI003221A85F